MSLVLKDQEAPLRSEGTCQGPHCTAGPRRLAPSLTAMRSQAPSLGYGVFPGSPAASLIQGRELSALGILAKGLWV